MKQEAGVSMATARKKAPANPVKVADDRPRKAYSAAEKALREAHADEFADLLDKAYADLGIESPRVKRIARQAIADRERQAREERKAAKALDRVNKARQELADAEAALQAIPAPEAQPVDDNPFSEQSA